MCLPGEAGVYLRQGSPPKYLQLFFWLGQRRFQRLRGGCLSISARTELVYPVNASTNAQWNLVTGDIYVYNLGALAAGNSSSTNAPIGAEGMIFYQTTIPSTTLAWQLWLNGSNNAMFVKKSVAPDPAAYDLTQAGQMLVVPPYLAGGTFNGSYFIGVAGSPGTMIALDSRQQPVTALPFNSLMNVVVTATNFPYVTYQVQVPVQQIAWQLNLVPTSGNPSIAVRRDLVPNEFRNDAFSETPQNVGASVSLVPPPPNSGSGVPGLSDGTFYVTVYSTSPYTCSFSKRQPRYHGCALSVPALPTTHLIGRAGVFTGLKPLPNNSGRSAGPCRCPIRCPEPKSLSVAMLCPDNGTSALPTIIIM